MKRAQTETPNLAKHLRREERWGQQENFVSVKLTFNIQMLFYTSLEAFDIAVKDMELKVLCSLFADVGLPKSMCMRCLPLKKGFAKEYFSYLATLPPSEDEHLTKVLKYCLKKQEEIKLRAALFYPRSEKFLIYLNEKGIWNPSHFDINCAGIVYQTLPKCAVETLWFLPEGLYRSLIMKHQVIYDSMLDGAVGLLKNKYPRHTTSQIKEYATEDPAIFKYELEDMPTVSAEFIKFLSLPSFNQVGVFYEQGAVFEKGLFKYMCKHLEFADQLLPLLSPYFIDILSEFGFNHQDSNLSLELLQKGNVNNPDVMQVLINREWDPKTLFETKSPSPYILHQIVFNILKTKTDLTGWEMFPQHVDLKYLAHTSLDANFFKRHPSLWNFTERRDFWNSKTLKLIDELGEDHLCWKNINCRVFMFQGPINWQWASNHKDVWMKMPMLEKCVPLILYYKHLCKDNI